MLMRNWVVNVYLWLQVIDCLILNEIQFQAAKSARIGVLHNLSLGLGFLCIESWARIFRNRSSLGLEILKSVSASRQVSDFTIRHP